MSQGLRDAIALTLPTPASTLALQAALWPGDAGRRAFIRWADLVGDPLALPADRRSTVREMGPQLDEARRRHGVDPPARAAGTLLRAAGDRERRRWATYRSAVGDLVAEDRGAPSLVSGGLATALAAYPDPGLRHSHDLDRIDAAGVDATHPSGLPSVVHRGRLPPVWGHGEDLGALRDRAVPDDRLGPTVLRLSVGDLLLVVLAHAVLGRRPGTVRWAADAHLLAAAATEADWTLFGRSAAEAEIGVVVLAPITYLHDELGSMVPSALIDELGSGPVPTPDRRDRALACVFRTRERRLDMRRAEDRRAARALGRWGLWPSAGSLVEDGSRRSRVGRLVRFRRRPRLRSAR